MVKKKYLIGNMDAFAVIAGPCFYGYAK